MSGLNYDTGAKTYYLDLMLRDAPDRFGRRLNTSTTIIVFVEDVSDQDPLWVEPCFPKEVDENLAIG